MGPKNEKAPLDGRAYKWEQKKTDSMAGFLKGVTLRSQQYTLL